MGKIFGTDGVRGVVGEKITEKFVYDLAKSIAVYLNKYNNQSKVFLCHDTRTSASMIENAVCKGLNEFGIEVVCGGVVPTPAVHYLTKLHNFSMAIMITASHNTHEFNGLKLITKEGYKFSVEQEDEITAIYDVVSTYYYNKTPGKTVYDESLKYDWANHLIKLVGDDFSGLKIALDCANGANFYLAPYVFKKLGAQVVAINDTNNGELINQDCGSTHLEPLSKVTAENKCDLGFAFDGDADRMNAVYGNGTPISGEDLLFLCCMYLYNKRKLTNNKIITPYVTNCGIDESLKKFSIEVVRCDVGGKSIQRKMLEQNISYGAEDNGHIVWGDYNKCSDGLLTALFLTKLYKEQKFEDILKDLKLFEQVKIAVPITEEQKGRYNNGAISDKLEELKSTLNKNERIITRVSGTEPIIRVVVEGENTDFIAEIGKKVENLIKSL